MNTGLTRREWFQSAVGIVGALVGTPGAARAGGDAAALGQAPPGAPLFLSTWKQGQPANERAAEVFRAGGSLLDAIEKGINTAELDPEVLTVGYGGRPNEEGVVQLDAVIMDGATHRAGAVAALEKIPTPISVARRVMEKTYHTLLAGEGALRFALEEGFEPQPLLTPRALEDWLEWKRDPKRRRYRRGDPTRRPVVRPDPQALGTGETLAEHEADTITMVAFDGRGNLAAGGSTSGLKWKLAGRVGDVPLLGCGIYVDNAVGAAGATGDGDEMQKFCTSATIVERMRAGMGPQAACEEVLRWMLEVNPDNRDNEVCVYAVTKRGHYGAVSIRPQEFRYALWTQGVNELRVAPSVL